MAFAIGTSTDQLMPGCIAGKLRDREVGAPCRLRIKPPSVGGPLHFPTRVLELKGVALATPASKNLFGMKSSPGIASLEFSQAQRIP